MVHGICNKGKGETAPANVVGIQTGGAVTVLEQLEVFISASVGIKEPMPKAVSIGPGGFDEHFNGALVSREGKGRRSDDPGN